MFDLTGRVALVTGAGRGIGAGVAATLARQGAAVAVNDRDGDTAQATAESIRERGGSACALPFDVCDLSACREAAARIATELGPVDILVNNAGGTPGNVLPTPFRESPEDLWGAYLGMNLVGVLNATRAVLDGMCERGFGRVIAVSSDAARVGHKGSAVYGAAKAGAEGFIRSLAKEVGGRGVTANAVALGLIDTVPAEFLEGMRPERSYAMARIGNPDDVAAGIVYLASDEAGWVTGHTLVINGGYLGA